MPPKQHARPKKQIERERRWKETIWPAILAFLALTFALAYFATNGGAP